MPEQRYPAWDGLYRRLNVASDASLEDIVRSYRRLAHDTHPDTRPDDPDASRRFQEITEAYEVLSDRQRRANYDRARPAPRAASPPRPGPSVPRVVIGGTTPSIQPGAPLTVGPVHVVPDPAQPRAGASYRRLVHDDIVRLLDDLLASAWWD